MSRRFVFNIKSPLAAAMAAIIASSFLLAFLAAVLLPDTFSAWNNQITDHFIRLRYRLTGKQEVSPYLIHVVINDESQQALGLPSWDRTVFGRVLDTLQDTPVELIACDVFFKDPSFPENDRLLLEASNKSKRAIFPVLIYPQDYVPAQNLDAPAVFAGLVEPHLLQPKITRQGEPPVGQTVIPPFTELCRHALGLGHINYSPDHDGRCRRVPLLYRYADGYIPAFSLRIVLEFFEVPEENVVVEFGRHIVLRDARIREDLVQDVVIPIDHQGQIIVNYAAPWDDSFLNFPVHKLLAAADDDDVRSHLFDLMDGALVVLSDISTTNRDYGPGVFETVYPLSGIHVTVVNSILTQNFLRDQRFPLTILFTLLFALPLWLLAIRFRGLGFSVGCIVLYALFVVFSIWQFMAFNRVPGLLAPSLGFLFALLAVNVQRIFVAEKEKSAYQAKSEASQKLEAVNRELFRQKRNLETANKKLAQMDRFKTKFLQNITHEFRTPLTLIIEPLDSIWNHGADGLSEFVVKNLTFMRKNAHKLLQLVNQFLDLSKFEAGKVRLEVSRSDIVDYLRTFLIRFRPIVEQKNVNLKFNSSVDSFPCYFDQDKLDKIFTNLLSNALKVTETDDLIEIMVQTPPSGGTTVDGKDPRQIPHEQMLQIDVRDTGSGIPEQDIPFIFDRFHQVDHPAVKTAGGSGVGLSLVRECVAIHHGHITVESKLGIGTQFTVFLPWAKEHFRTEEITGISDPADYRNKNAEDLRADVLPMDSAQAPEAFASSTGTAAAAPAGGSNPESNHPEPVRRIEGKYPEEPVLIIDDELDLLENYRMQLEGNGIDNLILCSRGEAVAALLREQDISVLLLDLSLPGVSGKRLLEEIKENYPGIHILVITGLQDVDLAVECIKIGAFDFMVKPVELSRLLSKINQCVDKKNLEKQIDVLTQKIQTTELKNKEAFAGIITHNETMLSKFRYVEAIAESNNPVLITGESGVGKELIAAVIHQLSNRAGKFVSENIAGLDDTMISDTLFGHAKGAFTDAEGARRGLVEEAAGGTLFLDEIGDMSSSSQVKLLRFIEQKEYRPLGADEVKVSDARIIIATNADLKQKLEEGTFRKDLFYRLTHQIHIPPLRERLDDLPYLVNHFVTQAAEALDRKPPAVPDELLLQLRNYDYPGNIRELKNMIENALSRSTSRTLSLSYFKEYLQSNRAESDSEATEIELKVDNFILPDKFPKLKELEEYAVSEALRRSKGNQNFAARLLGLSPSALSRRIKKMGGKKGF